LKGDDAAKYKIFQYAATFCVAVEDNTEHAHPWIVTISSK